MNLYPDNVIRFPSPGSPSARGLTLVAPSPDTRKVDTGDPRRDAILSDASIHDAIRAVVRKRGVPESDVDDVLHDVIEDACADTALPLEDKEQARQYLCGCARYKSIDQARARARWRKRHVIVDLDTQASPGLSSDDRVLAHELGAHGRKTFPFTYAWFERFFIGGESYGEIAADPQVTPDHVRHEVAAVRKALQAFALAALALVIGALALHKWLPLPGSPPQEAHRQAAPSVAPVVPSVSPPVPPKSQVALLREQAERACDQGHWVECISAIDRAAELDPTEPAEVRALRNLAQEHLQSFEAKPRR